MRNEGNISGSKFYPDEKTPHFSQPARGQAIVEHNKILICSRDQDTGILLKTITEMWGFHTHLSDCLEQSAVYLEYSTPNLIILDSVLPFSAHLENLCKIRRHKILKRIPIIVISGFSQPRFKKLSIDSGANDFLVKPLDFDLLEVYIKRFIGMPLSKTF